MKTTASVARRQYRVKALFRYPLQSVAMVIGTPGRFSMDTWCSSFTASRVYTKPRRQEELALDAGEGVTPQTWEGEGCTDSCLHSWRIQKAA